MIKCQICGKEFKKFLGLSVHLKAKHKDITYQEYYDKYLIKNESEKFCIICGIKTKFLSIYRGYNNSCCSNFCADKKRKNSNKIKSGYEHYLKTDEGKRKNKLAWKNKTKDELNKIKEKRKKKNNELYGKDYYTQTDEYKERNKACCQEKYNCDNVFQCEEIKDKIKETKLERYDDEYYLNEDKKKETNQKNCGYDYASQSPEFRANVIGTMQEKHGVDNISQVEEIKQQKADTCQENFGNSHYLSSEHSKIRCLKLYGTEYAIQDETIFNKAQQSAFKFKEYKLPSGKIIKYQGYENKYLDEYFLENRLEENIIVQPTQNIIGKIWYYTADGKKHRYFPDIYIEKDNLIIEVKSTYTYNRDLEINLLKQQACIDLGFNFEFRIYDSKGNLINSLTLSK